MTNIEKLFNLLQYLSLLKIILQKH